MEMLRWMCGKIRKNKIKNEYIRGAVGVTQLEDNVTKDQSRWYVLVQWKFEASLVRIGVLVWVEGGKERSRRSKVT